MLAQDGRQDEIELVLDTQRPEKLNPSLIGACTELVCFRLQEKQALTTVAGMEADADLVSQLPLGSFVSWNRLSGTTLSGKVF